MEKQITTSVLRELINSRLEVCTEPQNCSYILPDGTFVKCQEHYDVIKYIRMEQLVPCVPDGYKLLSELGWLRYSYVGYIELPETELTEHQYESLEKVLEKFTEFLDNINIMVYTDTKIDVNYSLGNIGKITDAIREHYKGVELC